MSIIRWTSASLILLAVSTAACSKRSDSEPTPQPREALEVSDAQRSQVITEATSAIAPFKKQLTAALTEAMSSGGPVFAIDVCSREAPRLAAQASSATLTVGRSSLKLRNPNNAARPWLQPVLVELDKLPNPEGGQRVVRLDEQRFGYAEAITLKPLCATCHGTNVAPEIAAKLRERYPEDRATGYEPGQLRGVFWAEVALAKNSPPQ